jgi:hypothetical protein
MLEDRAARNEIPPVPAEMTEVFRSLGNLGAYARKQDVRAGQVLVIDDYIRAIVEYI